MTVMVGQQCGTDCDPCCPCGPFCLNGYCGRFMQWIATHSGASVGPVNAGGCTCTDLDGAPMGIRQGGGSSQSADDWNAARPAWTGRDAKDGTRVCSWIESDTLDSSCAGGSDQLHSAEISVYRGVDDKWYLVYSVQHLDLAASATLAGEAEFDGGGAAMDCGEPGEGTPTFSLNVNLSSYNADAGYGDECGGPTSVLIEGDPQ